MSIKARIMQALKDVGYSVSYLQKSDDGEFPFVVFNVGETPKDFSDDEEDSVVYLVTINIFSRPDFNYEGLKKDIVKKMKENGFKKGPIPNAVFLESENVYNQPMGFLYYEEY